MLCLLLTGCAVVDNELRIAGDLIVVSVINNKPKVRVSTGVDECKWRGTLSFQTYDYELWVKCSIPFTL